MGDAKKLIVKPIAAADATKIIKSLHYSGKNVQNSQLHLGVFYKGRCGGAMQFGPSLDKRKMQPLVKGTLWNEFLELNRMAFADWLPRNGESRCIAYAMRWIGKTYPQIKWVVSFADATQCGDGTIYRASGFVLTGIKTNTDLVKLPDGTITHSFNMKASIPGGTFHHLIKDGESFTKTCKRIGAVPLVGHQLRYLFFIDPACRENLTVPVLPYSEIVRQKADMYKGKPRVRSEESGTPGDQPGGGGANPTRTL